MNKYERGYNDALEHLLVKTRKQYPAGDLVLIAIQTMVNELRTEDANGKDATESELAARIYNIFPKKVGKGAAITKIIIAMRKTGFDKLKATTELYAGAVSRWTPEQRGPGDQFIPNPSTWFHQRRYEDDPKTWIKGDGNNGGPRIRFQ